MAQKRLKHLAYLGGRGGLTPSTSPNFFFGVGSACIFRESRFSNLPCSWFFQCVHYWCLYFLSQTCWNCWWFVCCVFLLPVPHILLHNNLSCCFLSALIICPITFDFLFLMLWRSDLQYPAICLATSFVFFQSIKLQSFFLSPIKKRLFMKAFHLTLFRKILTFFPEKCQSKRCE